MITEERRQVINDCVKSCVAAKCRSEHFPTIGGNRRLCLHLSQFNQFHRKHSRNDPVYLVATVRS